MQPTTEQLEEKRKQLEAQHGKTVHLWIVYDENESPIIAYALEPSRDAKRAALDKSTISMTGAGDLLLRACLIREESDPRILDDKPENDTIYFSFLMKAQALVRFYATAFVEDTKKK